jgi:hypothetical protein
MEAPDGRDTGMSRTAAGDFSPGLSASADPFAAQASSPEEHLPRPDTKASTLKTTGERFPLVHP